MVSFESDYIAGAHPEVLNRLIQTNQETLAGYGDDFYSGRAKEKIRAAVGLEDAEVELLAGGTQTNAVVISTMLSDYEAVMAAETGHISVHEAGAIEYCGHKVITLPQENGKLKAEDIQSRLSAFYADPSHEHMPIPGMVYISWPTEYGTLYTKKELEEISGVCKRNGLKLYLDGARLAYGLMSRSCDLSLKDIAALCDVFYIGGTKAGALCGEAVVFTRKNRPKHFLTSVKKRGALLAKGRLLGVQFDALFTDELYYRIGKHAIDMAERMKEIFRAHGIGLYLDSPTNQQFAVLPDEQLERLKEKLVFCFWEKPDPEHTVVRFASGWSTSEEDLKALEEALDG